MDPELIRPAAAATRYSLSRRTLGRRMKDDPTFPRPIRLGSRVVLFKRSELDAYFEGKRGTVTTVTEETSGHGS
ncbi:helix-turn-helix transcriptional regulator [Ideonella oryzae]|uniref:AlpA family phage regulatory protein n=1 Tax=Ideonella oryzae TaxID=2937441 RepID=A0ABT1BKQ9_9BURK|nr:AlpA family phage regulatory protein [Ideonella oryzae]MCO5976805.1 AlpA family phage regulatory protein [Ideonella oryzae]